MDTSDRPSLTRLAVAVLVFLGVTALGTFWWQEGGRQAYGRFFSYTALHIYDFLGFENVAVGGRQRFVHIVPFVGLMAATPGLSAGRRFGGMAMGLVALFVWQLIANFVVGHEQRVLVTFPMLLAVVSDVLPFVLWVWFARGVVSQWMAPSEPADPGA